jgi:tetratricopeptide (TPR) repeat protein
MRQESFPAGAVVSPTLVLLVALAAPALQAQTHKHYEENEQAAQPGPNGAFAPLLQGLGAHTFPVTTKSSQAQLYVSQGVNLAYGFNHAEAGRAFREAARLDPECAMAYWGQALVLGPNINAAMDSNDEPKAHELAQKALALKGTASPREQALIEALVRRYTGSPDDRPAANKAYAEAMRTAWQQFPADDDIAALYAEAVMDRRPWAYWRPDGTPKDGTLEIASLLESVIQRNPRHPLALHLYIHLMEPVAPAKAELAADLLGPLMPGAGHMVHMPSHIYQRVGRYADAVRVNELASQADESYLTQCRVQGFYAMAYYPHNVHFIWSAAAMDGRGQLAIDSARKVAARIDDATLAELPLTAGFRVVPYFALTRFGRWDEMLKEPEPPASSLFLLGAWHYARGLAFLAKGDLSAAETSLAELRRIAGDKELEYTLFSTNTAARILAIAPEVLAGELAAARKSWDAAIGHLDRAVRLEDGLDYTEPAEWHYPPRHALGAVLLEAGRPAEAETVYWEDLKRNSENGWALLGLSRALADQGKTEMAAFARQRYEKAWTRADVKPRGSRMMRAE